MSGGAAVLNYSNYQSSLHAQVRNPGERANVATIMIALEMIITLATAQRSRDECRESFALDGKGYDAFVTRNVFLVFALQLWRDISLLPNHFHFQRQLWKVQVLVRNYT